MLTRTAQLPQSHARCSFACKAAAHTSNSTVSLGGESCGTRRDRIAHSHEHPTGHLNTKNILNTYPGHSVSHAKPSLQSCWIC